MPRPIDARPVRTTPRRLCVALVAVLSLGLLIASTASAAIAPVRGVSYGPVPGETLTIFPTTTTTTTTVALRSAAATLPASVILVHGGGWRTQFSETEQPTVAQGLRAHGFVVFDINYPQSTTTETAFPKQPEALDEAIDYVGEHAAEYGSDPANIVLLGGSAGGHLVDFTGEQHLPGVRAVISLSGPTNLVSLMELAKREEVKTSLAISLAQALGCPGKEVLAYEKIQTCGPSNVSLAEQFSPTMHVPASACPNWQLYSAEEDLVPVSQQREFLSALKAKGCSASLRVLAGPGHSFGYWPSVNSSVYSFIAEN
jgi:acetyl esterase/lipase